MKKAHPTTDAQEVCLWRHVSVVGIQAILDNVMWFGAVPVKLLL